MYENYLKNKKLSKNKKIHQKYSVKTEFFTSKDFRTLDVTEIGMSLYQFFM